jgi:hypothetical protein
MDKTNFIKVNNSEKYIEKLKLHDKILVKQRDLTLSNNLIKTNDLLWSYYSVKSFKIDEKDFNSESLFPNYNIYCGDCFMGECYLIKKIKK